jgi:molecular chaperone GrpE (heat shock protein)
MLNWRRDPGYEQRKLQHEQRMKQLENDILQAESDILRVRKDSEQIKKETEQLRRENAREQALSASIRRLCFPRDSSSTLPSSTEPDCRPSSP